MCNPELGVTLRPRRGSRHPAEYLTDIDFADDIALVSKTVANAQILLQKLKTAAATVGFTINQSKTKAMITGDITLKTRIIKTVDDFCYLGSWVAESNKDMNTRKAQAGTAMNKLSRIWKVSFRLVVNSNFVFSEPLLKPYYYSTAVSAGF